MFNKMFKITKAVRQFQAGESTGFGFQFGAQYYDRKAKEKKWCNYKATVFAKNPNQIALYQSVFVEGSHVEISAEDLCIDSFTTDDGRTFNSIELIGARVGSFASAGTPHQQQVTPPVQQGQGLPVQDELPF